MDYITQLIKNRIELDEQFDRTNKEWRRECNEKGLEIYYDMSNPKEVAGDCDCEGECTITHTMNIGTYKTRPCPNHSPGHQCNPVGNAMIKNLSVSPITSSVYF